MKSIIQQVKDASNILWYVRTQKVVDILENNEYKNCWHRERKWKYVAVYVDGNNDPLFIWCKTKVDAVLKFMYDFTNYYNIVTSNISLHTWKKLKKEWYFSL